MENNRKTNQVIIIIIILILIIGLLLWCNRHNHNQNTNSPSNISNNNTVNSNQESNINNNINSNDPSNYNSNTISNSTNSSHKNSNNFNSISNNNKHSNNNNKSNNIKSNNNSNTNTNNHSNYNNVSNTSNINGLKTNGTFSGIFQKDNIKIIIYQHKTDKIHYRIINTSTGRQYIGKANLSNQKAIGTINYSYTFTLNNSGVNLSTTDPNREISGNYIKTNNYTSRDYYSDYIGELKYENSIYNGIFKSDKGTIKLYQENNKETVIKMIINNQTYNQKLNINNGKLEHEDSNGKISISISGHNLSVTSSSPSAIHPLFSSTGTYQKIKPYTIEEIINDRF